MDNNEEIPVVKRKKQNIRQVKPVRKSSCLSWFWFLLKTQVYLTLVTIFIYILLKCILYFGGNFQALVELFWWGVNLFISVGLLFIEDGKSMVGQMQAMGIS